ncbi:MAG TPA: SRPBCC family protein [Xanthobacteraceae bacterium]|nr:SRPBCC family protein [Xanthobacteraceae bacterium]
MGDKPKFVYVTYIAASPEKVWQALTDPALTEKYWFGFRVDASGEVGCSMTAVSPDGKEMHRDPIIESDPPRRLSYAWHPLYKDLEGERPSRVTFELTPLKDQTRLTIVHDEFDDGSKIFGLISNGWPAVLSSMKSFLETGRGLQPSWGDEAAKRSTEGVA